VTVRLSATSTLKQINKHFNTLLCGKEVEHITSDWTKEDLVTYPVPDQSKKIPYVKLNQMLVERSRAYAGRLKYYQCSDTPDLTESEFVDNSVGKLSNADGIVDKNLMNIQRDLNLVSNATSFLAQASIASMKGVIEKLPAEQRISVLKELEQVNKTLGIAQTHIAYHTVRAHANTVLMRRDLRLKAEPKELIPGVRTLPLDSIQMFPGFKVRQEELCDDLDRRNKLNKTFAKPNLTYSQLLEKSARAQQNKDRPAAAKHQQQPRTSSSFVARSPLEPRPFPIPNKSAMSFGQAKNQGWKPAAAQGTQPVRGGGRGRAAGGRGNTRAGRGQRGGQGV